jgi:hypothetical protein
MAEETGEALIGRVVIVQGDPEDGGARGGRIVNHTPSSDLRRGEYFIRFEEGGGDWYKRGDFIFARREVTYTPIEGAEETDR